MKIIRSYCYTKKKELDIIPRYTCDAMMKDNVVMPLSFVCSIPIRRVSIRDEFNVKSIRRLIIIIRPGVESPATRD